MPVRWYRVPETGSGTATGPNRPNLFGHSVEEKSANKSHPDAPPTWIVAVVADDATLDALAAEDGAIELSSVPVDALNQILDQDRDADGWERGFGVER